MTELDKILDDAGIDPARKEEIKERIKSLFIGICEANIDSAEIDESGMEMITQDMEEL